MSGIYIHIPFCKQACFYCDFHFSTSLKKKSILVEALVKELEMRKVSFKNEIIETIYFGGGTPSILSTDEIELLLTTIYKNYTVSQTIEITLEANPEDLTDRKIDALADSQVNRLSIGIQSFFEDDLKQFNRIHTAEEAKKCLSYGVKRFDNITIDLIYGIPKMSNNRWKRNLQTAFGFGINHISSYALTVEPKTALNTFIKQGKYPNIDQKTARQHFDILIRETQKRGFIQYEISNFGKPGYFSKHNTSYWLGKKYMGIGPSAHSFDITHRSWNVANNTKYIRAIQDEKLDNTTEKLSVNDKFNECIMLGLRTIWGVSLQKIAISFGQKYTNHLERSAVEFLKEGVLEIENRHLLTTDKGKFLTDGIASKLFII